MQIIFLFLSIAQAASTATPPPPTRSQCRDGIINHKADDSVSYTAGSTASGKKVAPADLPTNRDFEYGKTVVIPTDIPLKDYAQGYTATPNDAVNATVKDSKIYTGVISMEDGKIRLNGQSTDNPKEEKLRTECKKLYPNLH